MLKDIYGKETMSRGPVFEWEKILLTVQHKYRMIQNPVDKRHIYKRKHRKSLKSGVQ
jgi:hypothetical protein